MTTAFKLPLISEGVESADVAAVHVHEGDVVQSGQVLLEVETEKAVAEIPSPQAGRIAKVLVKPGQTVRIGDALLEFDETAGGEQRQPAGEPASKKSEAPAPSTGTTAASPAKAEAPRGAGSVSGVVSGAADAGSPAVTKEKPAAEPAPSAPTAGWTAAPERPAKSEAPAGAPPSTAAARGGAEERDHVAGNGHEGAPIPAGPATRRLARELGVDLHRVSGSGPGGRITTDDVQAFVRSLTSGRSVTGGGSVAPAPLPPFDRFGPTERQPLSKLARVSAANLSAAWQTVPHVTQHELADVTELEESRQSYLKTIGQNGPKITMTAIMVKAVVGALRAFPQFNSSIDLAAGELILKRYYHIGVAVDTEFGLLVPVIRDADRKTVLMIAAELAELARKARERKLDVADMQGGTFTITNLGGIGGTAFTPIVNFPEAAILGLSRTQTQLKLIDGKLVERLMLPLSLSYDHRIINGADAARFIVKLSAILSDFFQLLVEC
jgi:pyruvate dehydrogenase E2 component (dihydrolipoamide acetyltransferase)